MWLYAPVFPGHFFMVRLLLIRHAATDVTESGGLLGATDVDASPAGLTELARLFPLLGAYQPEKWYCSPLKRSVQTAEKLQQMGAVSDQPVKTDIRLREIDFGRWELKPFNEIEAEYPDLIKAWAQYDGFVFPGGEAVADFAGRVANVLDSCRKEGNKQIGVITHGGVIRTMICLALGMNVRNYLLFNVEPASLTIIDLYPEGGVLAGLNL